MSRLTFSSCSFFNCFPCSSFCFFPLSLVWNGIILMKKKFRQSLLLLASDWQNGGLFAFYFIHHEDGGRGVAMIDLFFPNGFALENTITLTSIFPRVFPHVVFLSLFFSFRKKSIDSRPGKGETPKNITRSLIIITLGGWVVDPQSMPFVSMLV